jgi:hypothetical protein
MKYFSITILLAACCVSLSCINPFAPHLNYSLGLQLCNDLTQAENVFCAFRNAYSFKDTTLYGSLLSTDFIFIYTDYDQLVEKSWGRDDEMKLTHTMFQSVQSLSLVWNSEISFTESDTSETIERGYDLTVTFSPDDIMEVNGVAEFLLVRARAGIPWKLSQWQDKSNF